MAKKKNEIEPFPWITTLGEVAKALQKMLAEMQEIRPQLKRIEKIKARAGNELAQVEHLRQDINGLKKTIEAMGGHFLPKPLTQGEVDTLRKMTKDFGAAE